LFICICHNLCPFKKSLKLLQDSDYAFKNEE
jgi:hypothetical protein